MKENTGNIKKSPYALINRAGIALMLLTLISNELALMGFWIVILFDLTYVKECICPFIAVNIAGFITVKYRLNVPGVMLTLLGGGIGSVLAVRFSGGDFPAHRVIKSIFLIQVWLMAWIIEGYILFSFSSTVLM